MGYVELRTSSAEDPMPIVTSVGKSTMFDYRKIEPVEGKVVHIICYKTGEVLKTAEDMSRHFPEGKDCSARHDMVPEDEKPS